MENSTISTGNGSAASAVDDYMNSIVLRAALIVAYSVIFVLGVAGNTLVVYVVARNASMQTNTNVFIANLAVSDIMMCLLAVPFTPISGLLQAWPFGSALCRLVPMTLGVSVYVSTLTSTAIAVDRYCVIVHPFLRRMRIGACLVLIVIIWLVAISISLPLALYQHLVDDGEFHSCEENWPGASSRHLFTVISMVLQYIAPCVIIIFCYARVSVALRRRARGAIGTGGTYRSRREANENGGGAGGGHADLRNRMKLRRKRRTNRMLIAMVAIFAVCWLPLNVILLSLEHDESIAKSPYFLLVFFAAHVVAMSSTVYNPFLYAWMNDNFRKEFRRVLPFLGGASPACHRHGSAAAATSVPGETTLPPAVVRVRAKCPRSPSRYSSATGRTDPPGGSGDRQRSGTSAGRGPVTLQCKVDEQQVRFVNADDNYDNYDGDHSDNVGFEHPANISDDNGIIGQHDDECANA